MSSKSNSDNTVTFRRPAVRSERGIVLIIALMAIVLLMALLLWVINLGQQVNHRVTTQNAADASAQAGSSWIARQLNTVSYNNMEMARLLAVVPVLDAMPQAVDYAHREDIWMRDSLNAQLARGVGGSPRILAETVEQQFANLYADILNDIEDLVPVDTFFKQIDVSELTFYQTDGDLWRALQGLDEMNTAVLQNLGPVAQTGAVNAGLVNFGTRDKDQAAAMLPVSPTVPFYRGTFNDFLLPVLRGMPPADIDDPVVRRGPWDTVYGWRDIIYERVPGSGGGGSPSTGGSRDVADGGRANNPLSRREGSNGSGGGGGTSVPVAYRTWGPYSWQLRQFSDYDREDDGPLDQTRLSYYLNRIADRKINYVWPGSRPNRTVIDPDWRITYEEAKSIAQRGTPRIYETAFFVCEIKSAYPADDGRFMTPGTWSLAFEDNNGSNPRIVYRRRWQDPARWGIPKLNAHVWRDDWEYQVFYDASIGITPQYDGDGNLIPQPVYRIDHISFAGVNVGQAEEVRNPYEGFNPLATAAPAPTNLRHDDLPHDDLDARWEYLSVLAMARRDDRPQGWRTRFRGGRPDASMVAIAQAKVFNNHSWDLWTPMWRAELEPVSHYEDWLSRFDEGTGTTATNLDEADLARFRTYLENATDLAETMLTH